MGEELKKYLPEELLPVPVELIPLNTPLPIPLLLRIAESYVLFRPLGDVLTEERVRGLIDHGLEIFYIPGSFWETLLVTLENTALEVSEPPTVENLQHVRNALYLRSQDSERKISIDSEYLHRLAILGEKMANGVYHHPQVVQRLIRRFKDPTLYFSNHQVNVASYALAIGNKVGIPLRELKQLAFASLAHNLGNIYIPKKVLYKPGPLTKAEKKLVGEHPVKGSKLLEELGAPKEVVLSARQHHECVDGTGYPNGIPGTTIHLFARIIAIADVYDALTNTAPYQKPRRADEALEIMRSLKGKFDPNLIGKLSFS